MRWYFGGKMLTDRMKITECNIPAYAVVQVIVAEEESSLHS